MKNLLIGIQGFTIMMGRTLFVIVYGRPRYLRVALDEMNFIGVGSVFIVGLIGLCVGMIWAMEIATELSAFGAKFYLGKVTSPAIVRELGPVITAITVAGKGCSAMAAELASMTVTNQVNAMRAMGVDPIRRLVAPKLIASLVMLPMLTIVYDTVAILGGAVVSEQFARVRFSFFMSSAMQNISITDLISGVLVKPVIFGFIITMVSCYLGLYTRGGASGVREATTRAVVISFVFIFLMDFLITRVTLTSFGV